MRFASDVRAPGSAKTSGTLATLQRRLHDLDRRPDLHHQHRLRRDPRLIFVISAIAAASSACCAPSVAFYSAVPWAAVPCIEATSEPGFAMKKATLAGCSKAPQTAAPFDNARARRPIASDALLDDLIEHHALVQTARERGYDRDSQTLAAIESLLHRRKAR